MLDAPDDLKNPFTNTGELNKKMFTQELMIILNANYNSYLISGIDIDEDGHLDLFWQTKQSDGKMNLKFIYTNIHLDHYYLKSCMINQAEDNYASHYYGYGVIGSSARYIATNTNDD